MGKERAFYNTGMAGAGLDKSKSEMVEIPVFTQGPKYRHLVRWPLHVLNYVNISCQICN